MATAQTTPSPAQDWQADVRAAVTDYWRTFLAEEFFREHDEFFRTRRALLDQLRTSAQSLELGLDRIARNATVVRAWIEITQRVTSEPSAYVAQVEREIARTNALHEAFRDWRDALAACSDLPPRPVPPHRPKGLTVVSFLYPVHRRYRHVSRPALARDAVAALRELQDYTLDEHNQRVTPFSREFDDLSVADAVKRLTERLRKYQPDEGEGVEES
jgi:hypothetical protein